MFKEKDKILYHLFSEEGKTVKVAKEREQSNFFVKEGKKACIASGNCHGKDERAELKMKIDRNTVLE